MRAPGGRYGLGLVATVVALAVPLISSAMAGDPAGHRRLSTEIPAGAPGLTSPAGVGGTTTADVQAFAEGFNAVRADHGLPAIPRDNFRYDACMEERLFWMAEDPSESPASAWGHVGTTRSDGVPSVGCDGNLAGGMGDTGETVATRWWDSTTHRAALYKPGFSASTSSVCIYFAMTHGGVPDEPAAFTRAAARWDDC